MVKEFIAKYSWYLKMDVEPTPENLSLESSLPLEVLELKQAALERLDAVRIFTTVLFYLANDILGYSQVVGSPL